MKKTKFMTMFLVLLLLFSVTLGPGVEVSAWEYGYTTSDGMFDYSVSNGEVMIRGLANRYYYGPLTLPRTVSHEGRRLPVRSIGQQAFKNARITGSLIIPENVKVIAFEAFAGCNLLSGSLKLPDSLISIASFAFNNCKLLSGSLVLPKNLKSLGAFTFHNCCGFTGSLNIPSTLTNIEGYTFSGCAGFNENLTIQEGVKHIEGNAFDSCGFKNIYLPATLLSIEGNAFYNLDNLSSVISWANPAPNSSDYAFNSYTDYSRPTLITPSTPTGHFSYIKGGWLNLKYEELNVRSLSVSKSPSKTQYINGDSLNLNGGQLLVNASNAGVGSFTIPLSNAEISSFNSNSKVYGPQTITVKYGAKTTSFKVYLNRFKDVSYGHDFYYTVRNIASNGIMRGKGDGKYFGVADNLTRAEASVALVRAAGLKPIRGNAFSDVPFDHWANAFINAAAEAGILRGKGKGDSLRFAPNDNITRAELAVMVSRAFKLKKDSGNVKKFSDVPSSHWAYNFINNLTSNGIVGGYPDGRFGPEDPVTRGQFTVFVSKSMNRK